MPRPAPTTLLHGTPPTTTEILITVTGGAQDFNLPSQLQVAFDRGLVSAAQSAKAWIFTAGSDTGVCVPP